MGNNFLLSKIRIEPAYHSEKAVTPGFCTSTPNLDKQVAVPSVGHEELAPDHPVNHVMNTLDRETGHDHAVIKSRICYYLKYLWLLLCNFPQPANRSKG